MVQLVEWMDAVLQAPEDAAVIQRVGDAVREKFAATRWLPVENGHHLSRVHDLTGSMSIVSKLRPLWRQVSTYSSHGFRCLLGKSIAP